MDTPTRFVARLCWSLYDRPWVAHSLDAAGALLFVVGCIAFYFPALYATGVSLFLVGSLFMLMSVLGRILVRYGPG